MAADPLPPIAPLSSTMLAPEAPPLSEPARIVNTFIAPSKTFTDLRRNGSWWGPWLVISIVSLAFIFTMGQKIGFEQISKNEVAHSSRADQFEKLPADQQEQQLRISSKFVTYISYAIPLTIMLYFAITTLAMWATFKVGAGADVSYGKAYAIVFYSSLPVIIGSILGIISMYAGVDPEGFNVNNPVATNPAYFMDRAGNKFLYGMASGLDVIVIWTIILMGIGFACNSKVGRGKAIAIVAGWYIFWKLAISAVAR